MTWRMVRKGYREREKSMQTDKSSQERGFSLIELTVAIAITLIISGAIYGLLAKGQSSFRREPELSDRQQNIRVAMDLIQRDVSQGGQKMGAWFQVFRNGLNGLGPAGSSGQNTDFLEIWLSDGTCPDAPADPNDPTDGSNINTAESIPRCYSNDAFVLVIYASGCAKWGFGHNIHAQDGKLNFPPGQQPPDSQINGPGELAQCNPPADDSKPERFASLNIIRYEIAIDGEGVPGLYRSPTGGMDPGVSDYVAAPDPAGHWQLVARGIEDLQVEYRNGTNRNGTGWDANPDLLTCINCANPTVADYNTLIREVRVSLSARSTARNLEGQTTSASGNAVRGQLTSTSSPRAALFHLGQAIEKIVPTPAPMWN
jgi:prepilin-type N-terminal cleavage/methylation domain-containing protein